MTGIEILSIYFNKSPKLSTSKLEKKFLELREAMTYLQRWTNFTKSMIYLWQKNDINSCKENLNMIEMHICYLLPSTCMSLKHLLPYSIHIWHFNLFFHIITSLFWIMPSSRCPSYPASVLSHSWSNLKLLQARLPEYQNTNQYFKTWAISCISRPSKATFLF